MTEPQYGIFVKHSISLLNDKGKLMFIIPSIWMKPDKAFNYNYFLSHNILYIKTFSNTKTNSIFKGQAQTPTCYFLLENTISISSINTFYLFDSLYNDYILYKNLRPSPIPLDFPYIFNCLYNCVLDVGSINKYISKTNMPGKYIQLGEKYIFDNNSILKYHNVNTCKIVKRNGKNTPVLEMRDSNKPCKYNGEPKIIMAHKMFGLPYYDKLGEFGICNRDNYVILISEMRADIPDITDAEIELVIDFLNDPLTIMLYEATRYRMKYLEKYVFSLLPNIVKLFRISGLNTKYNYMSLFKIIGVNPDISIKIKDILTSKKHYERVTK